MPLSQALYKTDRPSELERAEYYQPHIAQKLHAGKWRFTVTERHGWYDDNKKEVFNEVITLDPEGSEGFDTLQEAWKRYDEQVRRRVADAFNHSFSLEFDPGQGPIQVYKEL